MDEVQRRFPVGSYVRVVRDHQQYQEPRTGCCGIVTSHKPTHKKRVPQVFVGSIFDSRGRAWGAFHPDQLEPCTEEDWVASRMIQELGR
jgi:hypothetical protein